MRCCGVDTYFEVDTRAQICFTISKRRHPMKTLIFFSIFFSLLALPALAELTDTDLDKIRLIVNESEKRIKQDVKAEIDSTEKDIKEYIDLKIDSVEKRLSTYNWVLYVFMPLIVAAIGVPTAIMAWRSVKDRSLERQVEVLTREIETLKQRQIVSP